MLIAANISTPHVREFCAFLVADTAPLRTPCRPLVNKAYEDCFNVVAEQVASHGGQQIIGWAIWELPGVFILNAGQRALQHEVLLPKSELRELERNDKLAIRLERRIQKRYESNF